MCVLDAKSFYQFTKEIPAQESGNVLLPNLCSTALEAAEGWPSKEDEEALVWAASTVMGGGLDSVSSKGQHLPI